MRRWYILLPIRETQIQSTRTHSTCPSGPQVLRHVHTPPRAGRGLRYRKCTDHQQAYTLEPPNMAG